MRRTSTKVVAAGVLLVALVLAGVVSRFADSDPDGLTKVSEDHGFAQHREGPTTACWVGYGSLTGVLGVLVVLGLAGGRDVRRSPASNPTRSTARAEPDSGRPARPQAALPRPLAGAPRARPT